MEIDPITGGTIVPYCYPYANGNCVHYEVNNGTPGGEPDPNSYLGPVNWKITWNDDTITAPGPYWTGSTPQLYDDPDYAVNPTAPYGTNCAAVMTVQSGSTPTYDCQFEFDITTFYNPTEPVDSGIGGNTKQFNDVVVAWPPTNTPSNLTIPLLNANSTPGSPSVNYGNGISFTITLTNNGSTTASGITLNDPLPCGNGVNWVVNPTGTTVPNCSGERDQSQPDAELFTHHAGTRCERDNTGDELGRRSGRLFERCNIYDRHATNARGRDDCSQCGDVKHDAYIEWEFVRLRSAGDLHGYRIADSNGWRHRHIQRRRHYAGNRNDKRRRPGDIPD